MFDNYFITLCIYQDCYIVMYVEFVIEFLCKKQKKATIKLLLERYSVKCI